MMPSRTIQRITLSGEVYRILRSAILSRELSPGSKLIVRALSERLLLSPTPIKLALAALAREGLVEAIPHRGYHIPHLTLGDVKEIYAVREVIEGLAARLAATRADGQMIERMQDSLRRQKSCIKVQDSERYGDLDLAFHSAIRKASRNVRLLTVAEGFEGQIRLLIGSSARVPGRLITSFEEHLRISDAISRRQASAAEDAMRRHVRAAGTALESYLEKDVEQTIFGASRVAGVSKINRGVLARHAI